MISALRRMAKSLKILRSTQVLLVMLAFSVTGMCQSIAKQDDEVYEQPVPELHVTLSSAGRSVMYEPLSLLVKLENRSRSTVTVQWVQVNALAQLRRVYSTACAQQSNHSEGFSVLQGESVTLSCELAPAAGRFLEFLLNRDTEFTVQASVKFASRATAINQIVGLRIGRPEYHVILGAAVGVVILSLFLALHADLAAPKSALQLQLAWRSSRSPLRSFLWALWSTVRRFLVGILGGAVTAILILVLTHATKGLSVPVVIVAEDFWGGLALGIFSIPLSKWLAKRIVDEPERSV